MKTTKLFICLIIFTSTFVFADVKISGKPGTFPTIQAAINAAVDGEKLLVSTGLYLETISITGKFLEIQGGYFSPGFTSRTNLSQSTIIGTNFLDSIVTISNNAALVIDTFEITGGNLTFTTLGSGVAIWNDCVCTAKNCYVTKNAAWIGGGFCAFSNATLFVEGSAIIENAGMGGGGIYGGVDSVITLAGPGLFCYNNYAFKGGGVFSEGGKITICDGALVFYNTARDNGGGIFLQKNASCNIFGEETNVGYTGFENQVTNGSGGGIYAVDSDIIISGENCRVASNYASDSGGGIYLTNSSLQLLDKAEIGIDHPFSGNYAVTNGGCIWMSKSQFSASGGAQVHNGQAGSFGGGIYAFYSQINFSDNAILGNTNNVYGNSAANGAGMTVAFSTSIFENASVAGNTALNTGGGFYIGGSGVFRFVNSVLTNNIAKLSGGGLVLEAAQSENLFEASQIINNKAYKNCAAAFLLLSSVEFNACDIKNNYASNSVGAIYNMRGNLFIENSDIAFNETDGTMAGILVEKGNLEILNSNFRNNLANQNTNIQNAGAVFASESVVSIKADSGNCVFAANSSSDGGAVTVRKTNLKIIAMPPGICYFGNNDAAEHGGAILLKENSTGEFVGNVVFENNKANLGGAVAVLSNCFLSVFKTNNFSSVLVNNVGVTNGGALFVEGPSSVVEIINAEFIANRSDGWLDGAFWIGGGGGAAVVNGGFLSAHNCLFSDNICTSVYSEGGAGILVKDSTLKITGDEVKDGFLPASQFINNRCDKGAPGGALAIYNSIVNIVSTFIASNTSINGGGIILEDSECEIINSILSRNSVQNAGAGILLHDNYKTTKLTMRNSDVVNNIGVGLDLWGGTAIVQNCILWGNDGNEISLLPGCVVSVSYCNVEGGYAGTSNINENPLFEDAANMNYQIASASPCCDVGLAIPAITNDCIGNARPYDGGWDIGAYEFVPEGGLVFSILCLVFCIFIYRREFHFSF